MVVFAIPAGQAADQPHSSKAGPVQDWQAATPSEDCGCGYQPSEGCSCDSSRSQGTWQSPAPGRKPVQGEWICDLQ